MKGCKQNFIPQDYDEASQQTNLFEFKMMPNADWLDPYYQTTFRDGEYKKKIPLANGRVDPNIGGKALIKVRKDNSSSEISAKNKDYSIIIRVISVLFGGFIFLNLLLLLVTFMSFSHLKRKQTKIQPQKVMSATNLQSSTYNELEKATNGFKEKLGHGAFGTVYKGMLASKGNELVAIKKLGKKIKG
ncbi:hypothetical protein SCA6_010996 [Theobroma cacao]